MRQMHPFWLDTFCLLESGFVTGGRHIVVYTKFCCMQHRCSVGRPYLYRSFVAGGRHTYSGEFSIDCVSPTLRPGNARTTCIAVSQIGI